MNEYSDDDWTDSGPFCRHWSDPIDCEIECARCGHACSNHGDGACMAAGGRCACDDFQEERPRDDNTIEQMTPAPSDGPCEDCGAPGWKGECPYAADVHNEHVEVILCERCAHERAQDI